MKLPPGYVAGIGVHKATAFGGLGQRLMEQMGWQKGQGLGKDKSGMKEAIEVKEKKDVLGVGADASWNWDRKYWEDAYNSAIQNINHETSSSSSGSSDGSRSSSSSESSDSDSESSGRGRGGKRARKGKSAGGVVVNRDGTLASASADELKIAAELAKDPWGRWGGRAGKMARIRAQEQEEANRARVKLGLPPLPVVAPPTAAPESSDSSDSDSDGPSTSGRDSDSDASAGRRKKGGKKGKKGPEAGKKGKKDKKSNKNKDKRKAGKEADGATGPGHAEAQAADKPAAKKRIVVVLGSDAAAEARAKMFATFKPTPTEGWWGAKMFVSVGLMESLEDEAEREARLQAAAAKQDADAAAGVVALRGSAAVAAGQRQGFCEDDQEALYKRAHDFQRVGRRGLGKAEIKVGAKWEGTKKTFGEDEDEGEGEEAGGKAQQPDNEEQEEEQQQQEEEASAGKKKGKKEKSAGKKKKAEADAEDGGEEKKSKKQKKAAAAEEEKAAEPESDAPATAEAGAAGANGTAAPPPKWIKLAKTVLKKSAERRMKLRKVVEELVAAAEEHHRKHHHHHNNNNSKKDKKDKKDKLSKKAAAEGASEGAVAVPAGASPWCEDSVREALERKIRKSNSGLALDGKYVTLVAAGGEQA